VARVVGDVVDGEFEASSQPQSLEGGEGGFFDPALIVRDGGLRDASPLGKFLLSDVGPRPELTDQHI
jgi:hypothetical protein